MRAGPRQIRRGDGQKLAASDRRPRAGEAGFTLLEILAAVAVLGLVMALLGQGVRFGLGAWIRQAVFGARVEDLDTVDRTVRELIGQMDPGSLFKDSPKIVGSQSRLAFISKLPAAAAGLPTSQVDVVLGQDGQHRLTLTWAPHYRNPIGPQPSAEAVLANGVERVEFSYWPPPGTPGGAGWVSVWSNQTPPALVRLHIVFESDRGRRWPDIVAAPMRERPGR